MTEDLTAVIESVAEDVTTHRIHLHEFYISYLQNNPAPDPVKLNHMTASWGAINSLLTEIGIAEKET